MRTKPDSRSKIDSLPAEKREILDGWLFDENLSFTEIKKRAAKKWKTRLHNTTLTRYYRTHFQRRTIKRIGDSARCANAVMKKFEDHPTDTYSFCSRWPARLPSKNPSTTKRVSTPAPSPNSSK